MSSQWLKVFSASAKVLFGIIAMTGLAGCYDAHKNDRQVISAAESRPVFGVEFDVMMNLPLDEISALRPYLTSTDYLALSGRRVLPIATSSFRFDSERRCYVVTDPQKPADKPNFARVVEVGPNLYLVSSSEGCFNPGVIAEHAYNYYAIKDGQIAPLGESHVTQSFNEWAQTKNFAYRRLKGLYLETAAGGEQSFSVRQLAPFNDYVDETLNVAFADIEMSEFFIGQWSSEDRRLFAAAVAAEEKKEAAQARAAAEAARRAAQLALRASSEPSERDMLNAMRQHWAGQTGRNTGLFNIDSVDKTWCRKIESAQYRCGYRVHFAKDCSNPVSCLAAITGGISENTAVFTFYGDRWYFGGAE